MGLNMSAIEDPRVKRKIFPVKPGVLDVKTGVLSPSFAVTQALVELLAKTGGMGLEGGVAALSPWKGKKTMLLPPALTEEVIFSVASVCVCQRSRS